MGRRTAAQKQQDDEAAYQKESALVEKYGSKKLLYAQALTIWNYREQQKAKAAGKTIPSWTAVHKGTPRYDEVLEIMRTGSFEELAEAKEGKPARPPKATPLPAEKAVAKKKPIALLKSFIRAAIPKLKEKVSKTKKGERIRDIISAGRIDNIQKVLKLQNLTTAAEQNQFFRKIAKETNAKKVITTDGKGKFAYYVNPSYQE